MLQNNDPFYSEENMSRLRKSIAQMERSGESPTPETAEAMLEADRIAKDPNVKGYTSIVELMDALDAS